MMGWERKRGKIEEFNRLLRGATDTSFAVSRRSRRPAGRQILHHARQRYAAARRRTRADRDHHPPAQPRGVQPAAGRVTEGYGILQPRISVTFMSAAGSLFARLYSGHTGVDPYTTAVSDIYQDLFSEGIFTGKGLYDVDAFIAALEHSVPENALLSHDLFEGLHARVALASDVELVDEYPSSVLSHARRQHRWIRGDWQILFWLFPLVPSRLGLRRNPLPVIGRWKILDNLRRIRRPHAAGDARGRLDRAAGAAMGVDDDGHGRCGVAAPARPRAPARRTGAQSIPVFLYNLRADTAIALAQVFLSLTFLAFHAFDTAHDRRHARAPRGDEAAAAGMGNRGHGGGAGGRARRTGAAAIHRRHDLSPMIARHRRAGNHHPRPGRAPGGRAVPPAVDAGAGARLLAQPSRRRARPPERSRADDVAANGAQDLALLDTFITQDDAWLVPDNLSGGRRRAAAGAPHVAHQHRDGPALHAGRARPWLHLHRRSRQTHQRDGRDARAPRTASRCSTGVRHDQPGAAPPALRFDRRQRKSGRAMMALARAGLPR